jgi:thiazole synthase
MRDVLTIGGKELTNRLFLGTGKFPAKSIIPEVIKTRKPRW